MRRRTLSREYALQILFQAEFSKEPLEACFQEFWERTSTHEIFPSKTTYFEPKICTGLLARWMSEESWQGVDGQVSMTGAPP